MSPRGMTHLHLELSRALNLPLTLEPLKSDDEEALN